jgi:hypothetical protein
MSEHKNAGMIASNIRSLEHTKPGGNSPVGVPYEQFLAKTLAMINDALADLAKRVSELEKRR